jgi:hypothetical protein
MVVAAEPRHHCDMVRLFILLFAVGIVLTVLALISCLSAERHRIRTAPRLVWVLLIVVFPLVGAVAWFFAGRPKDRPAGRPVRRPASPDDDPDFLGSLSSDTSNRDRQLFENWERDLSPPPAEDLDKKDTPEGDGVRRPGDPD